MLEQLGLVGLSSCKVCHLHLIQTRLCLEDLLHWNACHWQSSLPNCIGVKRKEWVSFKLSTVSCTLSSLSACFLLGGLAMVSSLSEPTCSLWACLRPLPLLSTRPSHHKVILFPGFFSADHTSERSSLLRIHLIHSQSQCQNFQWLYPHLIGNIVTSSHEEIAAVSRSRIVNVSHPCCHP